MRKILLPILISSLLFVGKTNSQEIDSVALKTFIVQLMDDFEIPGLSIGIVQDDSIVFSKGFGLRNLQKDLPVDANTTFGIGSISKSFTAFTLGLLVDQGLIDWDDKVKSYLPYFELYDPYVSDHFTIRDLLTHKSGLPSVSGGTLWYHSNLSREEVIRGLKYLKPVSGFREKTAYQNVMFVVAGEIVSKVTERTWDDFLRSHVLEALEMKNTTSTSSDREAIKNIARPHVWNRSITDKVLVKQELGDNLAAAGFIYSSANDMINYMRLLLNDGTFKGEKIVDPAIVDEIFKPQTLFQISSPPFGNEFSSYGLGWWLTPYKGHKLIEHSGGIDGMTAQLLMIKDLNFGVIILSNTSKESASFLLKAKILQMMLGEDAFDIYDKVKLRRSSRILSMQNAGNSKEQIKNAPASMTLEQFAGKYNDQMYGDINLILNEDEELELQFSRSSIFQGKLSHWHHDTFRIEWDDVRIPYGYLTFNFSADHDIEGFKIEQENLLDVDFKELTIVRSNN